MDVGDHQCLLKERIMSAVLLPPQEALPPSNHIGQELSNRQPSFPLRFWEGW